MRHANAVRAAGDPDVVNGIDAVTACRKTM
jgi:hypothetical protein